MEDISLFVLCVDFHMLRSVFAPFVQTDPVLMSLKDGYHRPNQLVFKAPVKEKKSVVVNGIDLLENVPPRTENEVSEYSNFTIQK